jgi:hypothetical protein
LPRWLPGDYNLASSGPYCLQAGGWFPCAFAEIWGCDGNPLQSWNVVASNSGNYQIQMAVIPPLSEETPAPAPLCLYDEDGAFQLQACDLTGNDEMSIEAPVPVLAATAGTSDVTLNWTALSARLRRPWRVGLEIHMGDNGRRACARDVFRERDQRRQKHDGDICRRRLVRVYRDDNRYVWPVDHELCGCHRRPVAFGCRGDARADGDTHGSGDPAVEAKSGSISGSATVYVDPPVTVATPASATPNPVIGTTVNMSVLGGYGGTAGAALLMYTWSAVGPAAVTYSANGANAAANTIATFTQAGSYTFTVTITGPFSSTTSSVIVTVNQTLTSIKVSPGPALTLGPTLLQIQQFSATAFDQFGIALATQPAFAWGLASGSVGSITDTGGLYRTGKVVGTATVKANNGAVTDTCYVTVGSAGPPSPPPLAKAVR